MAKVIPIDSIDQQINYLEEKKKADLEALKTQLRATGESMKPANLVKSAVQDVAHNPQVRSVFAKAAIGIVLGIVAKQVLLRKKGGPGLGKMALRFGVNMLIQNRYKLLKSAGALAASAIVARLRNKRTKAKAKLSLENPVAPLDIDTEYAYSVH